MATKKQVKEIKREEINIDDIKKEVVEYAEKRIDVKIDDLVKKADKRIISQKNRAIFKRNIIILLLVCLVGLLIYTLYDEGYFDDYFYHDDGYDDVIIIDDEDPDDYEEDEESKLDALKKQYAYLLDNINISEDNNYLIDLYNGKLTNKLKLSIAFANINKDKVVQDEEVYTINEEYVKEEYAKLFDIEKYKATSFELDFIEIKYLKAGSMYLFYDPIDVESHIKREIVGVNVKDNYVRLTVIEGYIRDNVLYSITTKDVINEKNLSIIDNCKKLNKLTYVFEKVNNNYILTSVEV